MTTISKTILGTAFSGYANTVPVMGSKGLYGVFDATKEQFIPNTPWHESPEKVIEIYDDMVMTAIKTGKKVRKPKGVGMKVDTVPVKKNKTVRAPIKRERGGDKLALVTGIVKDAPESAKVGDLIKLCMKQMPDVSAANFRYLICKVQKG